MRGDAQHSQHGQQLGQLDADLSNRSGQLALALIECRKLPVHVIKLALKASNPCRHAFVTFLQVGHPVLEHGDLAFKLGPWGRS
ncbi:hypothetical protein D3C77_758650 [compost metagenome]